MAFDKKFNRQRIKQRVRRKIKGTPERPRLSVYRSNKGIYCQLIDDTNGVTITSASSLEDGLKGKKVDQAQEVGKKIANKALSANCSEVVFDRNGYLYHGRVKSLAEGAREGGLKF